MTIIAVVGMAGSGKSTLFNDPKYEAWHKTDNIYKDLPKRLNAARELAQQGKQVLVSDVELCDPVKRAELPKQLGVPIDDWIFFENNPWQCAKNCLYRYFQKEHGDIGSQIKAIHRLSRVYGNPPDAREIWKCPDPPD